MKKIIFVSVVLFAQFSEGSEKSLTCTTPGDALDSVVVSGGNSVEVEVMFPSGKSQIFRGSNKAYGNSFVVVGRSAKSDDFGGGVSEAILLTLSKSEVRTVGFLAYNGFVYKLSCR
ncbi:MAG: hypothetical protein A4S09_03285 [Proteobacteria bacterium SG_bin7]|nr:MAG: hypothetical protein A4S09_03285 [Proteobacteria bacterium SG_bin7]